MKNGRMNIKEFSRKLGVSTATVSRAFSSKGRISEKTRNTIRKKAEELGYRANVHARNLIGKKSEMIAFFYPPVVQGEPDYFITEIIFGVSNACSALNIPLQIHPINRGSMEFYKDLILSASLSGVIVTAGSRESSELVSIVKNASVPYIVVGSMSSEKINSVTFNTTHGAKLAGEYLRRIGRKHPAYVGGVLDRRKKEGFIVGLGPLSKNLLFDEGGSTFQDGFNALERLIKSGVKIDSVLCANDVLAIGFIRAAHLKGIKIPEQIAVIGFDDIEIAKYYSPALTTLRLHEFEIGEKSVYRLKKMLDGEKFKSEESIQCELVLRESA